MRINQMTIPQFERMFPNEGSCAAYLIAHRWPDGVHCPRCGSVEVTALTTMDFHWQCYACAPATSYRFSHIAGTIFENTNKPLREWFRVSHMMLTSKKGVSALQIQRVMGFGSYETAWSMCHRIRAGLADEEFQKLMGIVEVDETYVGGDNSNRHISKRMAAKKAGRRGNTHGEKQIVLGAVERQGNVVARVIDKVNTATIRTFLAEAVSTKVSMLCADQLPAYGPLHGDYFMRRVDQSPMDSRRHHCVQRSSFLPVGGRFSPGCLGAQKHRTFASPFCLCEGPPHDRLERQCGGASYAFD